VVAITYRNIIWNVQLHAELPNSGGADACVTIMP